MKRTVEINDTLPEILESLKDSVKEILFDYLADNYAGNDADDIPDTPCLRNDLDYSGSIHETIDGSVPVYTGEINDLFYLHGSDFEDAFDDAGFGDKNDDDWPSGWKPAAIYCYLERELAEWYSDFADELVCEWHEQQEGE